MCPKSTEQAAVMASWSRLYILANLPGVMVARKGADEANEVDCGTEVVVVRRSRATKPK